jgi:hypothetical protein
VVGLILSYYWWERDYKREYIEAEKSGYAEAPMILVLFIFLTIIWPIKVSSERFN